MTNKEPNTSEYVRAYCTRQAGILPVRRVHYLPCPFPETKQPVGGRVHDRQIKQRLADQQVLPSYYV